MARVKRVGLNVNEVLDGNAQGKGSLQNQRNPLLYFAIIICWRKTILCLYENHFDVLIEKTRNK